MTTRLMFACMLTAFTWGGCAVSAPQPNGSTHDRTLYQEIGAPVQHEIQPDCRVPCSVSPGSGCC